MRWSRDSYILNLIVLKYAADCPCCGGESGVEAVNVSLLDIRLLLDTIPDLERSALVIGAVGAGDKLFVFSLEREPCLEV